MLLESFPFKNATADTMPPGALFVASPDGIDSRGAIQAAKVSVTHDPTFYVNGPTSVPAGEYGNGTAAKLCVVAYDAADGVPAAGAELGPVADSWYAKPTGRGLIVETAGEDGFFNAIRAGGKPVSVIGAIAL